MGGRGSGGRNRLPDAVKIARGTFRPDRSEQARSKPRVVRQPVPRRPAVLLKPHWSLSAAEAAIWYEVAPLVRYRGADADAVLSAFCAVAVRILGNPTPATADVAEYRGLAGQLGITEEAL